MSHLLQWHIFVKATVTPKDETIRTFRNHEITIFQTETMPKVALCIFKWTVSPVWSILSCIINQIFWKTMSHSVEVWRAYTTWASSPGQMMLNFTCKSGICPSYIYSSIQIHAVPHMWWLLKHVKAVFCMILQCIIGRIFIRVFM